MLINVTYLNNIIPTSSLGVPCEQQTRLSLFETRHLAVYPSMLREGKMDVFLCTQVRNSAVHAFPRTINGGQPASDPLDPPPPAVLAPKFALVRANNTD